MNSCILFSKRGYYKFIDNLDDRPFVKFTKMNCLLHDRKEVIENKRFTKYGYDVMFM